MTEQVTLTLCSIDPDWLSFWGRLMGPAVGGICTIGAAWGIFYLTRRKDRHNQFVELCVDLQLKMGSLISISVDILDRASDASGVPGVQISFPTKDFRNGINEIRSSCRVCLMHVNNDQIENTLTDIEGAVNKALQSYRLQFTEEDFYQVVDDHDSYWIYCKNLASTLNQSLERLSNLLTDQVRTSPPTPNPRIIKSR